MSILKILNEGTPPQKKGPGMGAINECEEK